MIDMALIDNHIFSEKWFKHFVPQEMHQHFRLFNHLYREWLGRELAWEREGKSRFGKVASRMIRAALRNESVFAAIGDPPPIIEIFIDTDFDGYNPKAKVMPLKLLAPITPFHGHGFISHFGHDDWL